MLTEERHSIILETIKINGSVKLNELCLQLNTSESTIRRDLNYLAKKGLLTKVHGGAVSNSDSFSFVEFDIEEKNKLYTDEKTAIAKYAASLINDGDFIFIDAGTTTEKMIDFIPKKNVTFVTNGFINARKLALKGFKVFIPAGQIKPSTEAIIGSECVISLQKYNFSKCFLGVNGISITSGFTTPDANEASVKSAVIERGHDIFFLADHSKFDKISSVTFAPLNSGKIITDILTDRKYMSEAIIKEAL